MRRIFGLPKEGRAAAARFLIDQGFDSVTVGADETEESVRPALDAGLRVWSCRAAFSVRHLPDGEAEPLLARDVDSAPKRWFGSGCPNQPVLREAHLAHVRRVAASGAFTGFMLDGIRFASPNAGDGFLTCFCDRCRHVSQALGLDFQEMRLDVLALRDGRLIAPVAIQSLDALRELFERHPGLRSWLKLRAASVIEHVHEVRRVVDDVNRSRSSESRFQLGAYLFFPSLAPFVGQSYAALSPLLDVVSPMLYRTFTGGDACLTDEWATLAARGLLPRHGPFTPTEVDAEVARARAVTPSPPALVPILQLADERLEETIHSTQSANPDGLDFFVFRTGHEEYVRTASRAMRAVV